MKLNTMMGMHFFFYTRIQLQHETLLMVFLFFVIIFFESFWYEKLQMPLFLDRDRFQATKLPKKQARVKDEIMNPIRFVWLLFASLLIKIQYELYKSSTWVSFTKRHVVQQYFNGNEFMWFEKRVSYSCFLSPFLLSLE